MFDACICVDDYETADVCEVLTPRARKTHLCGECGCAISPGETYERAKLLFDGRWSTHLTCKTCVRVRDSLFSCGGYYGQV